MVSTPNVIKESARGYQALAIDDILMQRREIFFTQQVTTESCTGLIKQLLFLDKENAGNEIKLYINSPGGSVDDGLAVYDIIRLMKSPVTTVVIGTAASMGSILFLAGDKREMYPNSRIMIHDPSYGGGNLAGKKPHQIKALIDDLVESQEKICDIIAERTGKSVEEIKELTKEDTYFNAEEAVSFGLATKIIGTDDRKDN